MKFSLKSPQRNRRWLMLGGAMVLGILATARSHGALQEHTAQLDSLVRATHRMVSVVAARQEWARGAQSHAGSQHGHMPLVMSAPCTARQHALGH